MIGWSSGQAKQVEHAEQYGIAKWYEPVSESLLERIQQGALASKFTKSRYKKLITMALACDDGK